MATGIPAMQCAMAANSNNEIHSAPIEPGQSRTSKQQPAGATLKGSELLKKKLWGMKKKKEKKTVMNKKPNRLSTNYCAVNDPSIRSSK